MRGPPVRASTRIMAWVPVTGTVRVMTEEPAAGPQRERRDWRDPLREASDLAALGILLTLVSVPVVTLGAALATGSAAVHDWVHTQQWPPVRTTLRRFARALLPGLGALVVA